MTISLRNIAAAVACCFTSAAAQAADVPAGPNTRAVVQLGEVYQGQFTFPNDGDWIRARVVKGKTYAAYVATIADANDRGGQFLKVFDRNRRVVATATSSVQDSRGLEFVAPLTGDVFLAVNAGSIDIETGSEPGSYPYTVSYDDDCRAAVSTSCRLQLGAPSSGRWTYAEDSDWRRISLVRGRTYELTQLAGTDEGSIRLLDRDGKLLAASDEDGGSTASFTAKYSGRYFVDAKLTTSEFVRATSYRYRLTQVGAATATAQP